MILVILSVASGFTVVPYLAIVVLLLAIFNIIVEPYKHNYRHIATHFIISLLFIGIFTMFEIGMSMPVHFTFTFGLNTSSIMTSVYLVLFALTFMYFVYVIFPRT